MPLRARHGLLPLLLAAALPAQADTPVELEQQIVEASAETADGPVQGYRATRSASATRTDTPIEEIPQAISVVPAQVLADLDSSNVERALDFAGGVSRQNNFGGLSLYEYSVRGFTTSEFYKDGFSANRGYPSAPDAANIERIEVLKGPAASLYGRGDPGGTVNIVTKKPTAETFARLQTSAGSWDRYRTSLDANAPLDEAGDLQGRVNLAVEDNGSFRDHVDSSRQFVAPSLAWQLGADTRLLVEGEFSRSNLVFDRGIVAPNDRLGSVSRSTFLGEPGDGHLDNDNEQLQASLEHDLNDTWHLRLASHYKTGRIGGYASESFSLANDGRTLTRRFRERDMAWHDSISQLELHGRLDLAGIEHRVLLGGEYENYRKSERVTEILPLSDIRSTIDIYQPVYGRPRPNGTRSGSDFHEQAVSRALNLQDQLDFGNGLHGLLGVRLERYTQDIHNRVDGRETDQRQDAVTWRSGLLYQLTPQVGVFANASTSFKPNSGLDINGKAFDPEEGIGYESGVKLDLFDGRLGATLAAFHLTKQNVLTIDPVDSDYNRAAGEARSQGFDVQVSGQVSDALRVIGAYAWIDAEVTKDNSLPIGSRLLGVPRHNASLLGIYEFQNGWLKGSDVGAAITHVGERLGEVRSAKQLATRDNFDLPSYTTVDLLAHYPLSERARLGVNLNNIFDEKYYERSYSAMWVAPGAPRNLTFNLSLDL